MANDNDHNDHSDPNAAFIRARRTEVGRDAERERLWMLVVETGMPPSVVQRLIEREREQRERENRDGEDDSR
jgi:hypothetical protein